MFPIALVFGISHSFTDFMANWWKHGKCIANILTNGTIIIIVQITLNDSSMKITSEWLDTVWMCRTMPWRRKMSASDSHKHSLVRKIKFRNAQCVVIAFYLLRRTNFCFIVATLATCDKRLQIPIIIYTYNLRSYLTGQRATYMLRLKFMPAVMSIKSIVEAIVESSGRKTMAWIDKRAKRCGAWK